MLSDLRYRLRALFRRTAMERELAEELQFHYERTMAKFLGLGMTREEAARRARLAMNGIERVKEECRESRGVSLVETSLQDLRYALRQLRRNPGFAAVVIASLALGIGANTAIFTLIDAVLLRMLPVAQPRELHFVTPRQLDGTTRGLEYGEYLALRAARPPFVDLAAYGTTRLNVSIDGSIEPTAEGQLVSGSYFSTLGVAAIAGRAIGPEDDVDPNAHPVAVISYAFWNRRFAREPATVGRTILISGRPFMVIGVTPPDFFGLEVGRAPDIYVPIAMQPTVMPAAESWLAGSINRSFWLTIVGRLRPEHNPQQVAGALAGIDVLSPLMTKPMVPGEQPRRIFERLDLIAAATGLSNLRHSFSQPLFVLMAVVGVVLLIACANVAGLVLARAASRQPELSMRLALGAGRRRLVRQLLMESVVLAVLGGACGMLLARWATGLLVTFMSSGRTSIVLNLNPDSRTLLFTASVSILTGILCGIVPALRASRLDVICGLKGHTRGTMSSAHWLGPGKVLVTSQAALCLVLLFGAGLFVRSLQAIDGQDRGFDRESVLIMRVEPRGSDQRGVPGTSVRLDRAYRDLLERLKTIPGVRSASLAHFNPTNQVGYSEPLRMPSGEIQRVPRVMVYPGYFSTMGIPIVSGRDLDSRDLDMTALRVGIVNEAFARLFLDGASPLGRQFAERGDQAREIIGVVKDSKYASLRESTPPLIYQPFLQTNTGRGQMTLHVRVSDAAPGVAARIREEVQRIDKDMPLFAIQSLAAQMAGALSRERLVATLSSLFGLLALLLASVGLYGLTTFTVLRRTSEIGIRMALGAARSTVVWMVMREAWRLVLLGVVVGVPSALLIGRLATSQVSGLLFGLSTTDPWTMAGAAAVLMVVAGIAAYLPAARAGRVDPIIAVRTE
jgi:predicted permease